MGRIHLFEFIDQDWCPRVVREATTDFLLAVYKLLRVYEPAYKKIIETIDKTKTSEIIDCCSGSGGPIQLLRDYFDKNNKKSITINLTDKFPNVNLFAGLEKKYPQKIIGHKKSLDATSLPNSLKGMRTIFAAFHHFSPKNALKILQNAVDNDAPIGIFECTQRHPIDFFRVLLSPILVLFMTPFAKQLTWQKIIFTYVIPVTPFTNMWEYFVSCLRTYSPAELHDLIKQIDAPDYKWEIGKVWSIKSMSAVTYLIGYKNS